MASNTAIEKRNRETSKILSDRLDNFEKNLGDLVQQLNLYILKTAKVRDEGDNLSLAIVKVADSDNLSRPTKNVLNSVAEHFAGVQDFRDVQVNQLEVNVLSEFCTLGDSCALAKERIKKLSTLRETVRTTNNDRTTSASKALVNQIEKFELKKVLNLKRNLMNLIKVELQFHARAIEVMSSAFATIVSMDEEVDIEHFRSRFEYLEGRAVEEPIQPKLRKATVNVNSLRRFSSQPEMSKRGKEVRLAMEEDDSDIISDGELDVKAKSRKSSEV
ncbi:Protein FAM92A-B [Halotydeus destructor]|nr:Protein FAM92A-B [Halotydeus destructor]